MNSPATKIANISVLEPIPVADLRRELEKYKDLPPYLPIGQAAQIMGVTRAGAANLHDRSDKISAERNELGHRIFRRDGCVAYRWAQLSFYANDDDPGREGFPLA